MIDLLILASETEGVPADHIAAKLAVPLGIVFFCGSVYLLLWSNYGAKKGALIYGTAFGAFCTMLGIFWWFGAPGTPVATGLQNFPGQAPDAYVGAWYAFEPGSERASFFEAWRNFEEFQTLEQYAGTEDPEDPGLAFLRGDLQQAAEQMLGQWLPTSETGGLRIGANRRTELEQAAGDPPPGAERADPFFTARVDELRVTEDDGVRLAGARITTVATYVDLETGEVVEEVPVEEGLWFAFKDPGALWFPSAVWTGIWFVVFLLSLFGLDRLEQREKRAAGEVQEPEDLATPIAQ